MIARILRQSFFRQKGRKAIAFAAVTLGTATAAALANMALDVGDKVSRELRSFGANLSVLPAGGGSPVVFAGEDLTSLRPRSYLSSSDILKVKENFWKNNVLAFAPFLDTAVVAGAGSTVLVRGTWFDRSVTLEDGQKITTGVRSLYPFWSVQGDWPRDFGSSAPRDEALVGQALARRLHIAPPARLVVSVRGRERELTIVGIVRTGGEEDDALLLSLETAQSIAGAEGKVDRLLVSALTTPENVVYERIGKTPRQLPPAEFERWSCTPFVSSIAYQIEQVLPGAEARPIRRVADSEGRVLTRVGGLMGMIALMAAIGAALTVTSALVTGVLERHVEIGLLKALGASEGGVVGLFLAEAALIGLLGGAVGGALGILVSRSITLSVFGTQGSVKALAVVLAVVFGLVITLAGCAVPARRIARLRAVEALRG
jgi:putative ABC transport system permease protein